MDGLLRHATSRCLNGLSSNEATLWLHLLMSISAPTWVFICGQSSKVDRFHAPDWGCRRRYAWTSYRRLARGEPAIASKMSTFGAGDVSAVVFESRFWALPMVHIAWPDRGGCLNLTRKYPTLIFVGFSGRGECVDESVPLSSFPPMMELRSASWVTNVLLVLSCWACGKDRASSSKANRAWSLVGWISMTFELKSKLGTDAAGTDCDWNAAMILRVRNWYRVWSLDVGKS